MNVMLDRGLPHCSADLSGGLMPYISPRTFHFQIWIPQNVDGWWLNKAYYPNLFNKYRAHILHVMWDKSSTFKIVQEKRGEQGQTWVIQYTSRT